MGGKLLKTDSRLALHNSKRVAIYTRKSTSIGLEQEFNSLDAQREACAGYVRSQPGWKLLSHSYDDGGFTGANLERPAFAKLLRDVEAGGIDIVVVYKVDRLSRSLLDFARVMDFFNRSGTAFVSVTQNFSTADAIGRLTLNMLMSFAEFEREMISERTRDKIAASRRKGMWTGGTVPLGYDLVEKKLKINPVEAELVREIFRRYLDCHSALRVAKDLNAEHRTTKQRQSKEGVPRGGGTWNKNAVLNILKNPVLTGLMPCGQERYEAEHEAIVEREVFEAVQQRLEAMATFQKKSRNSNYLLTGILFCGHCDKAMTPASTKRGTYRYYRCLSRDKRGKEACPTAPVSAGPLEDLVLAKLREAIFSHHLAEDVTAKAREKLDQERQALEREQSKLPGKIAQLAEQGKQLVDKSGKVPEPLLQAKFKELEQKLAIHQARLEEVQYRLKKLADAALEVDWVAKCLKNFDPIWNALTPLNQQRLVRAVVERLVLKESDNVLNMQFANLEASDPKEAAL
ncbi:MAG: hypothetical protein A2284_14755 [Deltaproteobacteria bacterium RIFOXYA12_FULL_61_11]|nr:MAG: hypothetical protein A2284_14755 [Deltaproteobacteria bacterium RIFOXYA12_FULL_61_11]